MKSLWVNLFLLIACFSLQGQEFELGKVSVAELQEKFHPIDSSAPAAILYKKGQTYFRFTAEGWHLVTEVACRVKIYKKEGYDYTNLELNYFTVKDIEACTISDAYTYNLEGKNIKKSKLAKTGIFIQNITKNRQNKQIAMPNVKEGSVIEYKYTIVNPFFTTFPTWYFEYQIPANYVEYQVSIPVYFTYHRFMSGTVAIEETRLKKAKPDDNNKVIYIARNVKPIKEEHLINNIENYTSVLRHELASMNFSATSEGIRHFSTNWQEVAKTIYNLDSFGNELADNTYFGNDINEVIRDATSKNERLKLIFNYVQSRMNWNKFLGYSCNVGVVTAYNDKVGNTAEINLMLTAMLRYAGLDANPVLVSTRRNGIALYPSIMAYDYVIVGVKTDKGTVLLDATSKNAMPDILPERALNGVGRMINKDDFTSEINLMPKQASKEVYNLSVQVDGQGKASGRARVQYFDYNAFNFRENSSGDVEKAVQKLEKQFDYTEVTDYKIVNDDMSRPVVEEYSFIYSSSDIIGDKLYITPMFYLAKTENPFKSDTRKYPVDFSYPFENKYMASIDVPAGYVIEFLPKPISLVLGDGQGSFRYNIVAAGDQVQLSITYSINDAVIAPESYPSLKDFFQKMIEKQNEKIILKKA